MSYLHNTILARKISYNKEKTIVEFVSDEDSNHISCNNLICRKSTKETFEEKFPRIVGSNDILTDLNILYCGHFKNISYKTKNQSPQVKEWMNELTLESSFLEASNFISLITKKSDLLIATTKYSELTHLIKQNIENSWLKWAKSKTSGLQVDLLYEESLNVQLVTQVDKPETLKGDLRAIFDFTLGESDKVLTGVDKITSKFYLSLPNNFLRWMRKEYIKRSNLSDYKGLKELNTKVVAYLSAQFKEKEKYFLIPLWTDKIANIIAKELQEQLLKYKGQRFNEFHNRAVKIPVEFRFGVFALKYLNERFKSEYRTKKSI